MYLITPDRSPEPGTAMVQRIVGGGGLGNYLFTPDRSPEPGTALVQRIVGRPRGLACGDRDCGCGLGLFESGMDLKQWGPLEWGLVVLGAVGAYSVYSTGKRGVSSVRKSVRRKASNTRRKRELQEELRRL